MLCVRCVFYQQLAGILCHHHALYAMRMVPAGDRHALSPSCFGVHCIRCLQVLSDLSKSKKLTPTSIEYVDIAGLVKGASTGEGLGNKFLANIRECDSIVQVNGLSAST